MGASIERVINRFASDSERGLKGSAVMASKNNRILYSYGEHLPIAIKMDSRKNMLARRSDGGSGKLERHQPWILLNGEGVTPDSARHLSWTFQKFRHMPRVAYSSLVAAIEGRDRSDSAWPGMFLPGHASRLTLLDFVEDKREGVSVQRPRGEAPPQLPFIYAQDVSQKEFDAFWSTVPKGAVRMEIKREGVPVVRGFHQIGSVLLRYDPEEGSPRYILCGLDEERYFSILLPGRALNIPHALDMLKPERVRRWEKLNGISAARQGEWYFLPVEKEDLPTPSSRFLKGGCPLMTRQEYSDYLRLVGLSIIDIIEQPHPGDTIEFSDGRRMVWLEEGSEPASVFQVVIGRDVNQSALNLASCFARIGGVICVVARNGRPLDVEKLRVMKRVVAGPSPHRNIHLASWGMMHQGNMYGSGMVRHVRSWGDGTREHRAYRPGKAGKAFWLALKNRELGSWGARGTID